MLTTRDLKVVAITLCLTFSAFVLAAQPDILHSTVFRWDSMTAKPTPEGFVRSIYRGPTTTLDELEMHVSTLNPGVASHPPHKHGNEEVIVIHEGTLESFSGGKWVKAGTGSIIFEASNELHAIRNAGTTPATYTVISFRTVKTPN